jgi:hypothetical protein
LNAKGTRRDPSHFEYLPSLSAPAVLGRGRAKPPQSTAVLELIAQEHQDNDKGDGNGNGNGDGDNDNSDSEDIDIDDLIDPRLKLSTTQLGLQRLEEAPDTYQPGTLPLQLYQTNPFARQQNDGEIGGEVHELAANAVPATAEEIRQMDDDEDEEEALSQAIEAFMAPTRAGRKCAATSKVVDNAEQARQAKIAKSGGRGGRGGSGRGRGRGRGSGRGSGRGNGRSSGRGSGRGTG